MKYEEAYNEVIKDIWNIAKKSPEHGNALMDILGEELYVKISKEQRKIDSRGE